LVCQAYNICGVGMMTFPMASTPKRLFDMLENLEVERQDTTPGGGS
jgi:hypothetical protein